MTQSLCTICVHHKKVVSGKGSRFFLCEKSLTDLRYKKYPPQPMIRCEAFKDERNQNA